jgi:hypothetical protein
MTQAERNLEEQPVGEVRVAIDRSVNRVVIDVDTQHYLALGAASLLFAQIYEMPAGDLILDKLLDHTPGENKAVMLRLSEIAKAVRAEKTRLGDDPNALEE